jgi:hypothetical protein
LTDIHPDTDGINYIRIVHQPTAVRAQQPRHDRHRRRPAGQRRAAQANFEKA